MGAVQAFHRALTLLLITQHADMHMCISEVWAGPHIGHGDESHAGVLDIAGQGIRDHLSDRLLHAPQPVGAHPDCVDTR